MCLWLPIPVDDIDHVWKYARIHLDLQLYTKTFTDHYFAHQPPSLLMRKILLKSPWEFKNEVIDDIPCFW